ncbi:hypothetical protein GIB67_020887 [Kingdonia uniflora]|uniref:NF-X1-type zinc finger protein NFXL1 n=1 Tax=Kingdonia uniflora TaxID=39325 RepID=A0A7J7M7Q4_9MAGN|nr:hypothetical protein GIB67_020887 [Kingdonia uniflora]
MSSQIHNNRQNRSQIPPRTARQTWVPRGSSPSSSTITPTPSTAVNPNPNFNPKPDPPSNSNSNNQGNGGEQSYPAAAAPLQENPRQRGGNGGGNIGRRSYSVQRPSSSAKEGENRGGSNVSHVQQITRSSNLNSKKEVEKRGGSNLPQLVQEIQEKLLKGAVECMICYDMVRRSAPIWSCSSCYSIFHLSCIKKWARAPTSVDVSAEKNQGLNWRCPGCQSVQLVSAKEIRYLCFCSKMPDPPYDLYLTPHSCGEPCGKPLDKEFHESDNSFWDGDDRCPHNCVLQCHPGPCPPCKAFASPHLCPCGKKTITSRCSDRTCVATCGHRCDKVLECGRHRCSRVCHTGPCDPCSVLVNAECFCKKKSEPIVCGEMTVKGQLKEEDGMFSCSDVCGKKLGCGNHVCGNMCHPGPCGECELTPSNINSCYCGKTNLQHARQSCLDPIPTCSKICDKFLPCGTHRCKDLCHAGECSPCMVIVNQSCRCGSSSQMVECFRTFDENEKFVCEKPCGQKKSCGRHRCSERCCPHSNSRKHNSSNWDLHLCSMACGKKLRCGQHSCESLCHSGHCPPCLETIFTDLTCACGRTTIPPPLPCGTPYPSCMLSCLVPHPCGHSSSHSCHFGDCPPCPVPVAKECVGGHVFLRNIPCGSKDIRCNQFCGKTRQCGVHACARICHPPPCDTSCTTGPVLKASCGQICGAPRRDCKHTCKSTCHLSAVCPDIRCDFPVTITCSCGRITAPVPCDAGGSSHVDSVFEASVTQKLPASLQPIEGNGKKVPLGQRKLVCDEECAKVERKRVLADAFDIASPSLDALHFGENSAFPDSLNDLFRREPKWVFSIEERFKALYLGKGKGSTATGLKVHVFSPMLKDKRDAVRQIAERWKLSVHAAGWEPKRFLVVHVTPKSKTPARVFVPKGTLLSVSHQPLFDPLVDMDPRLVVALLDLPRDADISALVLRFGGECELVWLNDKNALAVFSDPARAATALRRLDNGSAYHGCVTVVQNGCVSSGTNVWGAASAITNKEGPWKKAVIQETGWRDDSWGGGDWSGGATHMQVPGWKEKEAPIPTSNNRYNLLDPDSVSKPSVLSSVGVGPSGNHHLLGSSSVAELELKTGFSLSSSNQTGDSSSGVQSKEVVDDWEEAYE